MTNIIASLLVFIVFTTGVGLSFAFFYYFLFSKNSYLKKKLLERKINNLLHSIGGGNYEFIEINGLTCLKDKFKNKIYVL